MRFIFPLLFVVSGSGTMMMLSKRRFEEVLPVFLMCSIIIIFLSGFLNNLLIGYLAAIALAAIFPLSIIMQLLKRKDISDLRHKLFTPGFCIFIILYVFIYILNYNRGFTLWDEISHWGPMVKETLRLDKFYSVTESALGFHKDYPPAIPLFEALWCKLSGGYKEAYLYTSLQTLSLSLFFPALSEFNWKKNHNHLIKIILLVFVILSANIVIRVGAANFYQSIYIDCFLGLLFGYCLFLVIHEKRITRFSIFRLSVALIVLLLTKQMGLVFFFIAIMAFAINQSVIRRHKFKEIFKRKPTKQVSVLTITVLICILIIPMIFLFSWNTYVSAYDIHSQFNISDIKIIDLAGIVSGNSGEEYQHTTFVNFSKAILTKQLFDRPISLSYWQLMILAAVVFFLIGIYGRQYFEKYQLGGLNIAICMGAIGYALVILLLYLFSFSSYEAIKLASYDRYLNTYWFAVFELAIMLFLYINEKKEDRQKANVIPLASILVISWLVFFKPASIQDFVPRITYKSVTSEYQDDSNFIINHTNETARIFIIAQNDNGYIKHKLMYLTLPRKYNGRYYSLGKPYNEEDIWTTDISEKTWLSELRSYDYLYLCQIDDQFIEGYSSAFHSKSEINNGQLFKIAHQSDGMINFSLIE